MATTTSAHQIIQDARVENPSAAGASAALPERFWALVERYRGELVNQALAIVGNLADAEDVVQETFCEAFRRQEKLSSVRSLGAWLRTVNKANALNRIRDEKTGRAHSKRKQRVSPKRLVTTGGFSLLELREAVAQSIDALPPKLRAVVVLRYLEHLSYEQIAERLQLSPGTVGWLLCEAGLLLHGRLGQVLQNGADRKDLPKDEPPSSPGAPS